MDEQTVDHDPDEPYDDDLRDWDEEDGDDIDCGLMLDGQCLKAGSEECDFECPNRMSEDFAGSPAWCRKHGVERAMPEQTTPRWACPCCGKPVGIIGNWLAVLFGTRIHGCDFKLWRK